MKELNELVELAEKADAVANLMDGVNPHTILAIAEALRALEQRAEAAEEKLAELEKQEPFEYLTFHQGCRAPDDCEIYCVVAEKGDKSDDGSDAFPVYSRPAPAVSLAELVPDEMTWNEAHKLLNLAVCGEDRFAAFMMGANHNRKEILRNIEDKGI